MNFNIAEFYASYGRSDQIPAPEKPEIAFSGRSNVGKSSLINKLFLILVFITNLFLFNKVYSPYP